MSAETLPRSPQLGADGDLVISAGRLVFLTGLDAIRQDLEARLRFIRGSWFLDLDRGVDYLATVYTKPVLLGAFRSELRAAALATPGVVEVRKLELTLDPVTRTLTVELDVRAEFGDLVSRIQLSRI